MPEVMAEYADGHYRQQGYWCLTSVCLSFSSILEPTEAVHPGHGYQGGCRACRTCRFSFDFREFGKVAVNSPAFGLTSVMCMLIQTYAHVLYRHGPLDDEHELLDPFMPK